MNADNLQIVLAIMAPLLIVAFWLWMVIDCVLNKKLSEEHRKIWALVMILFPVASLFYSFWCEKSGVARLSD